VGVGNPTMYRDSYITHRQVKLTRALPPIPQPMVRSNMPDSNRVIELYHLANDHSLSHILPNSALRTLDDLESCVRSLTPLESPRRLYQSYTP
jgi:hypothetical protein